MLVIVGSIKLKRTWTTLYTEEETYTNNFDRHQHNMNADFPILSNRTDNNDYSKSSLVRLHLRNNVVEAPMLERFSFVRRGYDIGVILESEVFPETETFTAEDAVDDSVALHDPLFASVSSVRNKTDLIAGLC